MKFGKYDVVRKIGAGGFGVVYEGFDSQLRRRVAIKTCTTTQLEARERFAREASIGGNLQHRNITVVYDYGQQDGTPYMVQEYLTGEDLKQTIERRVPLSFATKLLYLIQAARGLGHAHRQGVIHRDIKPSNLRVLADGVVKIMDFGIARSDDVDISLTATGETVGTAAYLAPEQIRAEELDGRCDIYALGIVAYELFTYERAFTGKSPSQVLYAALNQMPVPIQEKWPDCPDRLQTTIERCYLKNRDERFQNCDQLLAALAGLLQAEQEEVPTEPPTIPDRASRRGAARPPSGQTVPAQATSESSHDTGPVAIDHRGRPQPPATAPPPATPASGTRPAVRAVLDDGSGSVSISVRSPAETGPQLLLSHTPPPQRQESRERGQYATGKRRGLSGGWLLFLFLVTAIAGGAFAYWQHISPTSASTIDPADGASSPAPVPGDDPSNGLEPDAAIREADTEESSDSESDLATTPADSTATLVVGRAWSPEVELSVGRTPPIALDRERRLRVPADVSHRLQFSYFGADYQATEELTVSLRPGQTRRIDNPLPRPARFSVLSDGSSQVFVRLDGEPLGWTPIVGRQVAPGSHRVELSDAVSEPTSRRGLTLRLRSGFQSSVTVDLDSELEPRVSERRSSDR